MEGYAGARFKEQRATLRVSLLQRLADEGIDVVFVVVRNLAGDADRLVENFDEGFVQTTGLIERPQEALGHRRFQLRIIESLGEDLGSIFSLEEGGQYRGGIELAEVRLSEEPRRLASGIISIAPG